eukprot:TRINITY_DN13429_c0_g1_i1.p1 TRINITY_DN13429_c0_g1~~TRINITY_DN13429_c0_g1_i1.p1  ORF type:complete len:548 (+),score=96.17 TRINITY_DN13429_c0_g1_i1:23-1666(+)
MSLCFKGHQPRCRLQVHMLLLLVLWVTACEAFHTTYECECLATWSLEGCEGCNGSVVCTDGCCNPNNDVKGAWCVVRDPRCEGKAWGYCMHFDPPLPTPPTLVTQTATLPLGTESVSEVPLQDTLTTAVIFTSLAGAMPQGGQLMNVANLCYKTDDVPITVAPFSLPLADPKAGALFGNVLLAVALVALHSVLLICRPAASVWFPKVSLTGVILLWPGTTTLSLRMLFEGKPLGALGLVFSIAVQVLVTMKVYSLMSVKGVAYRGMVTAEPRWVTASIGPGEWENTGSTAWVEMWGVLFQRYNGGAKMWMTAELCFLWSMMLLSGPKWSINDCTYVSLAAAVLCVVYLSQLIRVAPFASTLDMRYNYFSVTMQGAALVLKAVKRTTMHDVILTCLGVLLCIKLVPQMVGFCYRGLCNGPRATDQEQEQDLEMEMGKEAVVNPLPRGFVPLSVQVNVPSEDEVSVSFSHPYSVLPSVLTPCSRSGEGVDAVQRHLNELRKEAVFNAMSEGCYTPKNVFTPHAATPLHNSFSRPPTRASSNIRLTESLL